MKIPISSKRVSQRTNVFRRCIGLSVVVLILNLGAVSVAQAATDCVVTQIPTNECFSLLELYNSTDGANWTNNEGWNVTDTPCSWYGITCEYSSGMNNFQNVIKIELQSNQLTGTIPNFSASTPSDFLPPPPPTLPDFDQPSELFLDSSGLPYLQVLDLSYNQLTSTIPDFSFSFLSVLDLRYNQLIGTIPNFSALPSLERLVLWDNNLTGEIPNFNALPKLEYLDLDENQLEGPIPDFSASLPNLQTLYISGNQLCKVPDINYPSSELEPPPPPGFGPGSVDSVRYESYPDCYKILTITKTGDGIVTSAPLGIDCGSDCRGEYDEYTPVTLTATPDAGFIFDSWDGACSGTDTICTVTMNEAQEVTAIFQKVFPLTINKIGTGTGSVTENGIDCGSNCAYPEDTSITLIATADSGSIFGSWSGAGCSGTGDCTVTMNKAQEVTAIFNKLFPLTVNKDGTGTGSVTGDGIDCGNDCDEEDEEYVENTLVTLTAIAYSGSSFIGWGGACSGSEKECKIAMNQVQNVTATFDLNPNTLKVTIKGNGTVTNSFAGIDCGADCNEYSSGTSVTLTATPDTDYFFAGWNGADCSGIDNCIVTMTESQNVTATFELISPNTLKVTTQGNGTVTSSPIGIDCGADCEEPYRPSTTSVTLTAATPNQDYIFVGWDGAGCSGTGNCTVPMNQDQNVTATFELIQNTLKVITQGNGTVTSPMGINCGTDCEEVYRPSTTYVILTATPGTDYFFAGWNGADCSGTGNCTVPMIQDQNVTATFDLEPKPLKVTIKGNGAVNNSPVGIACGADCNEYSPGTSVTLTATPGTNYSFLGWNGAGCSGIDNCIVTMNQAQNVTATFDLEPKPLKVTLQGNGTVTSKPSGINCGSGGHDCSVDFKADTLVTLTAKADADYMFASWGGACSGTTTSCSVAMNQAQNVIATFDLKPNTLNVTVQGKGTVTSKPSGINCSNECSEDYKADTSVTLTATPDADYTFAGWSGVCSGTDNCTVTMNQAKNVKATFELDQFLLTISPTGNGNGTVTSSLSDINCGSDCSEDYKADTSVTLTATPDAGSIFTGWGNGCSGNAVTCIIKMNSDKTVTAKFDLCEYTVTPLKSSYGVEGGDGTIEVTAPVGCKWEAVNHNKGWLNITASNNGVVEYTVSANESSTERTGTFTITDTIIEQTVTIEQGIDVNEPPVALFTVSSLEGAAPLVVTVDASNSSDPDNDSITYQWETSDGHTATGITTDFTFEEVNSCEKTITLTVTDDGDLNDKETETVSLEDCAIVEFHGIEDYYNIGDFVRVDVKIDVNFTRFKPVDLLLAILMVESNVLLYNTPLGINSFSPTPQAYKESLDNYTVIHHLLDFEVPLGLGGTYIFGALFVEDGKSSTDYSVDDDLIIKITELASE